MKKRSNYLIISILIIFILLVTGNINRIAKADSIDTNSSTEWIQSVNQAMSCFKDKGGYCTSRKIPSGFTQTTWMGMDKAVNIQKNKTIIDVDQARPSFCSSAVYMLFLKSLSIWSTQYNHSISYLSWTNLKPYTMPNEKYPIQQDGEGAWGMANSNGPGFAVLINKLKMGSNYYVGLPSEYSSSNERISAFKQGRRYDVIKMFWNDNVGKDERGHIGIYLGMQEKLNPSTNKQELYVYWWTSNGSKTDINAGYGIGCAPVSKIRRAVFTRITNPKSINNVENIVPTDKDDLLYNLGSSINISSDTLKSICNIQ